MWYNKLLHKNLIFYATAFFFFRKIKNKKVN